MGTYETELRLYFYRSYPRRRQTRKDPRNFIMSISNCSMRVTYINSIKVVSKNVVDKISG